MRRTLPRGVFAAIVSIAAVQNPQAKQSTAKATAASQRDAAGLQKKIDTHLAAGEVQQASALVPQFMATQERALAADTVAMVLALRTCAESFIAAGPEGAAAADTLLVEGLNLRTAHFGPDHLEVAKSYNMLSVFHEGLGHYETATQYKTRALDIRSRQLGPEDLLVARTQHEFGVLDLSQGQFRDAGPHFEAALAVFDVTPPPDSTRLVALLNDVAELRRIETRYAAAESCLQRSLALGTKLFPPDDPQHADQLNNLAGLYKDQGRYEETEALLDRAWAMRIAATPPDSGALATAALNLAETYRLQDRPTEAAKRYEQATSLARRALGSDHPDLVWFLNQSAVFHAEQGETARAEGLYREALGILARAGGPAYLEAQTEHDLATLLETTNRHAAAESLYIRALATREELLGPRHPDVALTWIGLGQSVAASDPGRRAEAGRYLDRAAAILDSTRAEPEGRVEVHAARARLRAAGGDRPGAIGEMQVALEQVESLRPHRGAGEATRVRFLARHSEDAADLVDWCLREGDVDRAIETVERSRARAFLDRIAAAPLDPLAAIPPAQRQPLEERTAAAQLRLGELQQQLAILRQREDLAPAERRRRIAKLETERDAAAAELQRAQDAMLAASPVWRTAVAGGGSRISAAEIARRAPRDGLIVMYQVAAQRSHVIMIPPPPARPEAWELQLPAATATRWKAASGSVGAATLDRALGGRAVAESPPPAGVAEVALAPRLARVRGIGQLQEVASPAPAAAGDATLSTALYEMWQVLMPAPLWEKVRRASEVVVVPDAGLCQLPFEALVVERPDAKRAPRYWLDAGPIVRYALSGMSLVVPPRPGAAESASALGLSVSDPAYPPKGPLEPLPATARETAAIRAAFEPAPLTVLQGAEATEPRVRTALAGTRYVHLATHGVVDRAHSELLSGLALTPPAKPSRDTAADGMLQLFEIYDLHLVCDLAVLSACETSAGAWVEGEGVYALSRGFLAAGAKQVVASLWSVEDESTAALVGDLFREIAPAKAKDRKSDLEVARALRDAKRRIRDRKEWNAPFYWAPFVLTTRQ